MSMEWCEEKLAKLKTDDTAVPVLQEMKDFMTQIPRDEMKQMANSLQLSVFFDCLNDSNNEQVDLACEVLSLCMNNLSIGQSTSRYGTFLERALNHPFPAVKVMALTEIKRDVDSENVLLDLCQRTSLLKTILGCLNDEDLGVAKEASDILIAVGTSSLGINYLISLAPDLMNAVSESSDSKDRDGIIQMRACELLIKISVQSETSFTLLQSAGLIQQILNELDTDDVLIRLNVLELLSELGLCKHGFRFLESNDIFRKMLHLLESDDVVTVQLCEPGILKFLGRMIHWKPMEILGKYPSVFQRLFDNLKGDDLIIIGVTLDTLGYIGSRAEGKITLNSIGTDYEEAIKNVAKALLSQPTEIKVRALNAIENLLRVSETNAQISNITKRWYNIINDNCPDFVWTCARNPFTDIRLAIFGTLNAIAGQHWGHEVIKDLGMLDFLIDRSLEHTKECKEAKYEIVKLLDDSNVFDPLPKRRIKKFIREGAFFVEAITQVAVE